MRGNSDGAHGGGAPRPQTDRLCYRYNSIPLAPLNNSHPPSVRACASLRMWPGRPSGRVLETVSDNTQRGGTQGPPTLSPPRLREMEAQVWAPWSLDLSKAHICAQRVMGTSVVVQWLRLWVSKARGLVSIPGWERCSQKSKIK